MHRNHPEETTTMTHDWRPLKKNDPSGLTPTPRIHRCASCRTIRRRTVFGDLVYFDGRTGACVGYRPLPCSSLLEQRAT
jgi:hypothetical protein